MEPLVIISSGVLIGMSMIFAVLYYFQKEYRENNIRASSVMPFDLKRGNTFKDLGCGRQHVCSLWMQGKRLGCWDCDHRRIVREAPAIANRKRGG